VAEAWNILVADRNRHVRDLLRRELATEGYQVREARDGYEVWMQLTGPDPPDIIILDLDIPYLEDLAELAHFREGALGVPLIIYSYLGDYTEASLPRGAALLEKREDPGRLKEMVAEVLKQRTPRNHAGD
jgi:DNA-binding NtrC family response regulator